MKNKMIILALLAFILYFILFPQDAFSASCDGILLWFYQILPSLLPYAILSNIILSSNLPEYLSDQLRLGKITEGFVILCGFLFGFPIGSKLTADLRKQEILTKERAQILCVFTNNMSPAFVSNFVLTQTLGHPELFLSTCLILYGIPLLYGSTLLFRNTINTNHTSNERNRGNSRKKPASRFHMDMQIIDAGITNSFETLVRLCGYIVMFSVLAHIMQQLPLPGMVRICLTGILEVTNGVSAVGSAIQSERLRYLLAVAFVSFGGISGIAQAGSMITPAGLSVQRYVKDRILITLLVTVTVAGVAWYV